MAKPGSLSPNRLAILSGAFILLSVSFFFLPAPLFRHRLLPAIILFCGLVLSLLAALKFELELRNGIQSQRWNPEQLVTLRQVVDSAWMRIAIVCLLGLWLASYLGASLRALSSFGWGAYVASMFLIRLTGLFKVPRANFTARTLTPAEFAPLQSDHWGHHA